MNENESVLVPRPLTPLAFSHFFLSNLLVTVVCLLTSGSISKIFTLLESEADAVICLFICT